MKFWKHTNIKKQKVKLKKIEEKIEELELNNEYKIKILEKKKEILQKINNIKE